MDQPASASPVASGGSGTGRLIAVDWGTTSFRAYLLGAGGALMAACQLPRGILSVADGRFDTVLREAVGPWIAAHGPMPVLMSGMIGSRQGWHEVPYCGCPAGVVEIAAGVHRFTVEGVGDVGIVPGIVERRAGQLPDVMRGEETQVLGAGASFAVSDGLFVLPGTHSKWVRFAHGRIQGFRTYMTGEVYAALKDHTILGRLMAMGAGSESGAETGSATAGFTRGLEVARSLDGGPGALLHGVFSARTLALVGDLAQGDVADYLSGLLIGTEIIDAQRSLAGFDGTAPGQVVIIAGDALALRYGTACRHLGIAPALAPADCAASGIAIIARQAGLMGPP